MTRISHLDDLPRLPGEVPEDPAEWRPVRVPLGLSAFGVNAFAAARAGDIVIEPHDEVSSDATGGHEELYLVVRGAIEITLDDETTLVPAGGLVALTDPRVRRKAVAAEPDTVVVAVGATPGTAYAPSAWELRELGRRGLLADT